MVLIFTSMHLLVIPFFVSRVKRFLGITGMSLGLHSRVEPLRGLLTKGGVRRHVDFGGGVWWFSAMCKCSPGKQKCGSASRTLSHSKDSGELPVSAPRFDAVEAPPGNCRADIVGASDRSPRWLVRNLKGDVAAQFELTCVNEVERRKTALMAQML